jgi:hypothetical protein
MFHVKHIRLFTRHTKDVSRETSKKYNILCFKKNKIQDIKTIKILCFFEKKACFSELFLL